MTESELQTCVIDLAHVMGWRVAHFRPAKTPTGWRTPVAADGKGFPDLLMVRGNRMVAVELKSEGKYPTPEQREWLEDLGAVGEAFCWRPVDWTNGTVLHYLRRVEVKV